MTATKDDLIAVLEDRVAELEELLGIDPAKTDPYRRLGLHRVERLMLGYLVKREIATREGLFTVAYGMVPECDQPQNEKEAIGVRIYKLRNTLEVHGIKIKTLYKVGFCMSTADKAKLAEVMARLQDDIEPEHDRRHTTEFRRYGE